MSGLVSAISKQSFRSRGKKALADAQTSCFLEPGPSPKEFLKNWERLIQKIYEIDPLTCAKCEGSVWITSFIEDEDVIKKWGYGM